MDLVSDRLGSWKEIAAYFGKDVRTVRRWETERGLPIHRVPGPGRGTVFAYPAQLDLWLSADQTPPPPPPPEPPTPPVDPASTPPANEPPALRTPTLTDAPAPPPWSIPAASRWAFALVFVLILIVLSQVARTRPSTTLLASAATQTTPDALTRDLYLRARYLSDLRTEASLTESAGLLTQAIARQPRYAPLFAALAETFLLRRQYGRMSDAEAYARAYTASRQALALDPSLPEAHSAYAFVLNYWMWNFPAAEAEFHRALDLDPGNPQTHHWYATSLHSAGRYADARREIEIARQLHPDCAAILASRAFVLNALDPHQALLDLTEIERTNPTFAYVHHYLAELHEQAGDYPAALAEARQFNLLTGRQPETAVLDRAGLDLARHGAPAMFATLAQGYGRLAEDPASPDAMDASLNFARLHDAPGTLHFLELSCARRESRFHVLPHLTQFAFLRDTPQFQTLLLRSQTPLTPPDPLPTQLALR